MKCSVVVPAAGSGSRYGGEVPKQYVSIAGRPLIAHTLARLEGIESVAEIVVVAATNQFARLEEIVADHGLSRVRMVEGGASRAESVLRGLSSLNGGDDSIVAVHDAVRPLVSKVLFERLLDAAREHDGAFPGLPLTDTVHMMENAIVVGSPSRAGLVAAQTPQCFTLGVVRRALKNALSAGFEVTDEVSAVVRMGYRVVMVEGEPDNIKITRPEDMERAERLLRRKEA